ncbi:MAG TPA: AAA family ATPase [Polyangiaceae bacterium]
MTSGSSRFVFGPFEADERRFELRRNGVVVPLQRRTLEVIFFFLKNRGALIGKRELVQGPGGGVSVGDSALYRAVMLARRALENDQGESFITTVRGKGYRFEGAVRELIGESMNVPDERRQPAPTAPDTLPSREPLLGRARELSLLHRHLERARSSRGVTVVISGPAGIGKTALLEAFSRQARGQGLRVAQGSTWEGGGAPALLPWAELVRALIASGGRFSDEGWPPGFSALLAQLVPELASAPSGQTTPTVQDQGAHARFRLFEALARFLVAQARPGPLLLTIEDLHAADDASVLMLQFLRRSMAIAPLFVIVTLRTNEARERACLRELLAGGSDDLVQLPLTGLDAPDVGALLERIHGSTPAASTVETVYQLTEGNPLWVSELVRAGWIDGCERAPTTSPWQTLPVPERAVGWIAERLRVLPDRARRVVQAAAVMGREFSWPFLVEMLGLALPGDVSALRSALESGLIEGAPGSAAEFRFSHALVRDAVYASIAADVRYELHARAVATLAASESHDELRRVARLAHHAAAAIPLLGTAPAAEHALAAAYRARQLCSYELAAWHSRQALAFLDMASPGDALLRRAWLAVAESEALAGRATTAMEAFETLMSACSSAGEHATFAQAVLTCFEYVREVAVTSPLFHARAWEALHLCQEPSPLRARLLAVQALLSLFYMPVAQRIQQVEDALALARSLNDPGTLLSALRNGHFAALTPFAQERARERLDELAELAETFRDPIAQLEGYFWSAQHALDTGDGARFQTEVLAHARLAASIRHPVHLWYAALLDSVQSLLAGRLEDSIAKAKAAVALGASATGPTSADSYSGGQLLAVAWLREGAPRRALFAEVLQLGQRVLSLAPDFSAWRLAALVARFETEGASAVATEYAAIAATFDQITEDAYWLLCAALMTHLAAHFRDERLLVTLRQRLEPVQSLHVGVTSLYLGPVSFHLGRVCEALRDLEAARGCYERAAREALRCGAVSWERAATRALSHIDISASPN